MIRSVSLLRFVNCHVLHHYFIHQNRTMSTNVVSINENDLIDRCISILKNNGVLAVPTDTIYGFAALLNSEEAIRRIYEIKGRSFTKPLAISVGYVDDVFTWSKPTLSKEQLASGDLLPGPVTLMFERQSSLPLYFNPNITNVAIRIPKCQFMIELAQRLQQPIALTSANISNEPSSICIDEFKQLWSQVDLVIDGGLLASNDRRGSTIVDLSEKGYFHIQRHGIDCERIVQYLKEHCQLEEKNIVL
jgi:tRNA threonylcarbamoyl adenosine modification protein (Sua5/YciO/YrdC/YwlC family)